MQERIRQATFAAHPGNDWVCHFCNPLQGECEVVIVFSTVNVGRNRHSS